MNTPASGSTQATLVPVSASAVEASAEESGSGIDHIEVWNGNTKLGNSPKGTKISQWYSLAPGAYTLSIKDVTAGGHDDSHRECEFYGRGNARDFRELSREQLSLVNIYNPD